MNADRTEVASNCVSIFDRIQDIGKEAQVLALAAAFLLLCTAKRIPAQDAFTAVKNLMTDPTTSSGLGPQFQAMKYHLETEVLHDG